MSSWEYKLISSGPLGFASMQLLEQHLSQLGKDEWEIINFTTKPENPLVFHGLARRPVARDWFPPAVAKPAYTPRPITAEEEDDDRDERSFAEDLPPSRPANAPAAADLGLGEFDDLEGSEEDLPTLFEALQPFLRKNPRGDLSVDIDFLAKKFEQDPRELLTAFEECGLKIPAQADEKGEVVDHDGSLYWLERDKRGRFWVNTRDKKFKTAMTTPVPAEQQPVFEPRPERRAQPEQTAPAAEAPRQERRPEAKGAAATENFSRPIPLDDAPQSPRPRLVGQFPLSDEGPESRRGTAAHRAGPVRSQTAGGGRDEAGVGQRGRFCFLAQQEPARRNLDQRATGPRDGASRRRADRACRGSCGAGVPGARPGSCPRATGCGCCSGRAGADARSGQGAACRKHPHRRAAAHAAEETRRRRDRAGEGYRGATGEIRGTTVHRAGAGGAGGAGVAEGQSRLSPSTAGEIFWLNVNAKGQIWLNAKQTAAKKSRAKKSDE